MGVSGENGVEVGQPDPVPVGAHMQGCIPPPIKCTHKDTHLERIKLLTLGGPTLKTWNCSFQSKLGQTSSWLTGAVLNSEKTTSAI